MVLRIGFGIFLMQHVVIENPIALMKYAEL